MHRYKLDRKWNEMLPALAYICLNPSVADKEKDDRTVKQAIAIAKNNNFGGIYIINLFTLISTDPDQLKASKAPNGDDADKYIKEAMNLESFCLAWGNGIKDIEEIAKKRKDFVFNLLKENNKKVYHIGLTEKEQPIHPLYQPNDSKLVPWILK